MNQNTCAAPSVEAGGLADLIQLGLTLGFFVSVIKSGEPWTETCEQERAKAKAALDRLSSAPAAPERGEVIRRAVVALRKAGDENLAFELAHLSPSPAHTGEELVRALIEKFDNFWAFIQGEYGVKISAEDRDDHNVSEFFDTLSEARDALTIASQGKDGWFRIDDTENPAPKDGWFLGRWYTVDKAGHADWVVVQMRASAVMAGRQYFETWDLRLLTDPSHWRPMPPSPKED